MFRRCVSDLTVSVTCQTDIVYLASQLILYCIAATSKIAFFCMSTRCCFVVLLMLTNYVSTYLPLSLLESLWWLHIFGCGVVQISRYFEGAIGSINPAYTP